MDRPLALRYYRQAARAGDAAAEASASRVQETIKGELARLAASPSSAPQRCFLRDKADFYDLNGNEARPLFLQRTVCGNQVLVIANENNNEFARTNANSTDASGIVIGLFVRAADLYSCEISPEWQVETCRMAIGARGIEIGPIPTGSWELLW